jgi:NitT/TauT family transport system ATP-binding protein
LVALCTQKARIVLFVTHNICEACHLVDRVVVLGSRPGTVVADVAIELPRAARPQRSSPCRIRRFIDPIQQPGPQPAQMGQQ